jgi:hypothetical protein
VGRDTGSAEVEVQLWCASTRNWVGGFRMEGVDEHGRVRVSRIGDGTELPEGFPAASVRVTERRQRNWWESAPLVPARQSRRRSRL